jgi:hypothetical protein
MTWIDAFTVAACTAALLLLYHVVENLLARQMELSAFVQRWEPEPPTASSAGGG